MTAPVDTPDLDAELLLAMANPIPTSNGNNVPVQPIARALKPVSLN